MNTNRGRILILLMVLFAVGTLLRSKSKVLAPLVKPVSTETADLEKASSPAETIKNENSNSENLETMPLEKRENYQAILQIQSQPRNWCEFSLSERHILLPRALFKYLSKTGEFKFIFSQKDLPCLKLGELKVSFYETDNQREKPSYFNFDSKIQISFIKEMFDLAAISEYYRNDPPKHKFDLGKILSRTILEFPYLNSRTPLVLVKMKFIHLSWPRSDFGIPGESPYYESLDSKDTLDRFLAEHPDAAVIALGQESIKQKIKGAQNHSLPSNFKDQHFATIDESNLEVARVLKAAENHKTLLIIGSDPGDLGPQTIGRILYTRRNHQKFYVYRPGFRDLFGTSWNTQQLNQLKNLNYESFKRLILKSFHPPLILDVRSETERSRMSFKSAIPIEEISTIPAGSRLVLVGSNNFDQRLETTYDLLKKQNRFQILGFLNGGYEEFRIGEWLSHSAILSSELNYKDVHGKASSERLEIIGIDAPANYRVMGIKPKSGSIKRVRKTLKPEEINNHPSNIFIN